MRLLIASVIEGMTLAGVLGAVWARSTRIAFLAGFNTMALVTGIQDASPLTVRDVPAVIAQVTRTIFHFGDALSSTLPSGLSEATQEDGSRLVSYRHSNWNDPHLTVSVATPEQSFPTTWRLSKTTV